MNNWTPECDRLLEAANAALAAEPDATAVIAAVTKTGTNHCMTLHSDLTAPDAEQPFLESLSGDTALAYLILATPQTAGIVPSFDFATRLQSRNPENRDCQLLLESVLRDDPAQKRIHRTVPLHTCTDPA